MTIRVHNEHFWTLREYEDYRKMASATKSSKEFSR